MFFTSTGRLIVDYFLLVDYFISPLLVDYRLVDGSLNTKTFLHEGLQRLMHSVFQKSLAPYHHNCQCVRTLWEKNERNIIIAFVGCCVLVATSLRGLQGVQ